MGDDPGYDEGPYEERLKAAQVPLAPLPLTHGLGGIMAGGPIRDFTYGAVYKEPTLKETLMKQKEDLLLRIRNIDTLVQMIDNNPEHEKFLEALRQSKL